MRIAVARCQRCVSNKRERRWPSCGAEFSGSDKQSFAGIDQKGSLPVTPATRKTWLICDCDNLRWSGKILQRRRHCEGYINDTWSDAKLQRQTSWWNGAFIYQHVWHENGWCHIVAKLHHNIFTYTCAVHSNTSTNDLPCTLYLPCTALPANHRPARPRAQRINP